MVWLFGVCKIVLHCNCTNRANSKNNLKVAAESNEQSTFRVYLKGVLVKVKIAPFCLFFFSFAHWKNEPSEKRAFLLSTTLRSVLPDWIPSTLTPNLFIFTLCLKCWHSGWLVWLVRKNDSFRFDASHSKKFISYVISTDNGRFGKTTVRVLINKKKFRSIKNVTKKSSINILEFVSVFIPSWMVRIECGALFDWRMKKKYHECNWWKVNCVE